MKPERIKLIITLTLSLLISCLVVRNSTAAFERIEESLFDLNEIGVVVLTVFLGVLSVLSFIWLRKQKQFLYLIPLLICIGTIIFSEIVRQKIKIREASPVVFQATYNGDIHFLTIYLRENNTYKVSDLGFYGGPNHFGEYQISGKHIILDKKLPLGGDSNLMSNILQVGKENVTVRLVKNESFSNDYLRLRIVSSKITMFK